MRDAINFIRIGRCKIILVSTVFAALLCCRQLAAQTSSDLNSGLNITYDAVNSEFVISWWGEEGVKYYLQKSADMVNWSYLPVLEKGYGMPISKTVTSSEERLFFRLASAPSVNSSPENDDADGDSVADGTEVENGTDPFNQDTDGDGWFDDEEINNNTDGKDPGSQPTLLSSEEYVEIKARWINASYTDTGGQIEHYYWMYSSEYQFPSENGSWNIFSGWTEYLEPIKSGGAFYSDYREPPFITDLAVAQATLADLDSMTEGWRQTNGEVDVRSAYTVQTAGSGGGTPPFGAYWNGDTWETSYQTQDNLDWSGGVAEVKLFWKASAPRQERLSSVSIPFLRYTKVNGVLTSVATELLTIEPGQLSSNSGGTTGVGSVKLSADEPVNNRVTHHFLKPLKIEVKRGGVNNQNWMTQGGIIRDVISIWSVDDYATRTGDAKTDWMQLRVDVPQSLLDDFPSPIVKWTIPDSTQTVADDVLETPRLQWSSSTGLKEIKITIGGRDFKVWLDVPDVGTMSELTWASILVNSGPAGAAGVVNAWAHNEVARSWSLDASNSHLLKSEQNALKHSCWMALCASDVTVGPAWAALLGTAHEYENKLKGSYPFESTMDYHNNLVGTTVIHPLDFTGAQIRADLLTRLGNGTLWVWDSKGNEFTGFRATRKANGEPIHPQ
ncbi:DUF6973 domain-containing protein [Verrucomicrobium spinosum]|uniref:DUF6973 domain-containing protein n=1 Tax=Verrucomicrobium spinosum TaxID=2736 RepID=UPI00030721CC|nr:hypothetical protein [Verrucomicrobium spinosum]